MRRLSGSCEFSQITNIEHKRIIKIRSEDITCIPIRGINCLVIRMKKYDMSLFHYLSRNSTQNFPQSLLMVNFLLGEFTKFFLSKIKTEKS